ncbi:MAG: glycosyltransferase family 2 protein [Planctomycetes bacterium]|nr:glycosyltransferase family 2 protein [Planctomycetota bacterium]
MIALTVIVPVRNEARFIAATLDAVASQDFPRNEYEVLVVDGRSTDETRGVVSVWLDAHPQINARLLDNPGRLSSCGRNVGVRAAQGRRIAVIDGHVHIPGNQLLAAIVGLADEKGAECLARPAPLDAPGTPDGPPRWIAAARKSPLGHSRSSYIYSSVEGFVDPVSSGFAYSADVFRRVGLFDETFDAAEDVEFHHRLKRAGVQAYTSPELLIYSYPRESLASLFRQMTRYGIGRARLVRKHREAFTKETLAPSAVLLLLALAPAAAALAWLWPAAAIAYAAAIALYAAAAVTSAGAQPAVRGRLAPTLYAAAAIGVVHCGLGWGFLSTIVLPRSSGALHSSTGSPAKRKPETAAATDVS